MKQFKKQTNKKEKTKVENFYDFSGSWYNRFVSFHAEMVEKEKDADLKKAFGTDIKKAREAAEAFLLAINPDFNVSNTE